MQRVTIALTVVVLVAVVIVAAQLAERLGIQPPLFLLGVGVIACLVPGSRSSSFALGSGPPALLPPVCMPGALTSLVDDIPPPSLGSILSLAFPLRAFGADRQGRHALRARCHWGVAIALGAIALPGCRRSHRRGPPGRGCPAG